MKKTKKNYVLVALIVILLALAVGYSAFAQQLQITGTAKAKGDWNIHFADPTISGTSETGVNDAVLSDENKKMTVNVTLTHPGDSRTVTVKIKNEGSVAAKLTGFTIVAKDGTDAVIAGTSGVYTKGAIKMTLEEVATGDTSVLAATTGEKTYTMTFEWPTDYTTTNVDDTANFDITFDYEQSV